MGYTMTLCIFDINVPSNDLNQSMGFYGAYIAHIGIDTYAHISVCRRTQ